MNEVVNNSQNVTNNFSEALMERVQVEERHFTITLDGSPMSQEAFLALEVHPLGKLFSSVIGSSYRSLKADIAEQGMTDAVTIYEGKILDGKVRHQICRELIQEKSIHGDIVLQTLPADVVPIRYLISRNLQRRHLNESQRAIIGVRILTDAGKEFKGRTDKQVAELFNVSPRQAIAAKQVIDKGCPELVRLVAEGIIRVNMAQHLIALSSDSTASLAKQQEAIQLAEKARADKEAEDTEHPEAQQKKLALNAMRKTFTKFLASEQDSSDEPHDLLLLVRMNGTLNVSCDIVRHQEHADGILIRECASRSEAEQYQEEHRAELDGLVERARNQFLPIYEATKSTAAALVPVEEAGTENAA